MEEPKENGAAEVENYPLDEAMIQLLAELDQQMQPFQLQAQGALVLFLRQHKLQGNWRVAENRRELVKQPVAAPQPQN